MIAPPPETELKVPDPAADPQSLPSEPESTTAPQPGAAPAGEQAPEPEYDVDADIKAFADARGVDVLLIAGRIDPGCADRLRNAVEARDALGHSLVLYLNTLGGDPDAAYQMGRYLQQRYNTKKEAVDAKPAEGPERGKIYVLVTSICKSAGTLLSLGGDEIWMSDHAHLGPIDIQLRKPDEVGERTSGLTPMQALGTLANESLQLFKRHFRQLRFDADLAFSTRVAADVATSLTVGLLTPVYGQLDPIRLAEVERLVRISSEYGRRLDNGNLKREALEQLLVNYPSHEFVIDRREVQSLFNNVGPVPDGLQKAVGFYAEIVEYWVKRNTAAVVYL